MKIKFILSIALLGALASCGDDDSSSDGGSSTGALVGEWQQVSETTGGVAIPDRCLDQNTLVLEEGGTYEFEIFVPTSGAEGEETCTSDGIDEGKYSVSGSEFTFDVGDEDEDKGTFKIEGDLLTLTFKKSVGEGTGVDIGGLIGGLVGDLPIDLPEGTDLEDLSETELVRVFKKK